jgi:predicted AAA+ superfamily ATPase
MNFVLSGSSARKLKKKGVNLLAGRALTKSFFPLTAFELKSKFNLQDCLKWGTLPGRFIVPDPEEFLESYVSTYLQEEVQSEGLLRNLGAFRRFLEVASFSQAQPVVYSNIAHEAQIERKTIENYFSILEDLLIGTFIPVFSKKAKRELITKRKFFFFDAGVYNCLRPKGPLDLESEAFGPALETLVFNELRALNSYLGLGFDFFYWRTKDKFEIDLVLYGKQGLFALEIKNSPRTRPGDLEGLKQFKKDYPMAKCFLLNLSRGPAYDSEVQVIPAPLFFEDARKIFKA